MLKAFFGCLSFVICAGQFANSQTQVLGFSMPPGVEKVEIPIEIHNNLVVVPVIINNQLPLKFIIDTGVRTAI
ncbi:MAG: hypothetical protein LW721_15935, partial [Flammeovirgaceae bacterium]|nr:hypothetical protein [Flammeovirgaceae bacterium]